jgi:nucleotide-binding universal stress UspA family protein
MRGPIVVGVDGSAASRLALEEAAAAAKGTDREVVAVFVRHLPLAGLRALAIASVAGSEDAVDEMQIFAEAESIAVLEAAQVSWSFEVGRGEPAAELMRIAQAHDAGTIVVAGRRHGALGGFAVGAVTAQLLHRWSRCLLVAHPQASAGRETRPAG